MIRSQSISLILTLIVKNWNLVSLVNCSLTSVMLKKFLMDCFYSTDQVLLTFALFIFALEHLSFSLCFPTQSMMKKLSPPAHSWYGINLRILCGFVFEISILGCPWFDCFTLYFRFCFRIRSGFVPVFVLVFLASFIDSCLFIEFFISCLACSLRCLCLWLWTHFVEKVVIQTMSYCCSKFWPTLGNE